ncbi:hypothetical protein [Shewanella sp. S1-49-MNA-CIBAN-0167]|uniref:hypothetical protein n=1 Tax=Shewanella sp. S1-49-MNA-CIBAN-0167 TaxID=3140468 RepID=UPI00331D13B7
MTNKKVSFKEATKDMNPEEINIYRQGLSNKSFADIKPKNDAYDLHATLFPEEYDFIYDSNVDAKERKKGINPMNQEYTDRMNQKRIELGISPLGSGGKEEDSSSIELCHSIVNNLSDSDAEQLISVLTNKNTNEMVAIINKLLNR